MTRIIQLLNQKNHYLEKFYSLNEEELLNFNFGNFDNIGSFYDTREKILETIKYIDEQISEGDGMPPARAPGEQVQVSPEIRRNVREQLAIKDEYVSRILNQDLQVLACIEKAKSEIIRELQEIRKNKKAFSGYRTRTYSHRLNEEA